MGSFHLPEAFEAYSEARKAGFLKVKAAKEGGKKWPAASALLPRWRFWMPQAC